MDRPTTARALSIDLTAEPPFRIGAAEVFPLSRDARAGDHCERLQPQTLKVLLLLARHRGDVVTREELIERIWDGRFVGEGLQRALREDPAVGAAIPRLEADVEAQLQTPAAAARQILGTFLDSD